jgi:hypothetical protein
VLKSDGQLTSFMGAPVRNRATGTWTIHLVQIRARLSAHIVASHRQSALNAAFLTMLALDAVCRPHDSI